VAPRKRRTQTIELERGPDGTWAQSERAVRGRVGQTVPGFGYFDPSVGVYRDLSTGMVGGPGGRYIDPPVPGMLGRWHGKGTKKEPRRFIGVPEKFAAAVAVGALIVWGAEVVEADVSNWWSGSVANIGQDLTKLDTSILDALGFSYATNSNGVVTAVGARGHATFWSWVFNQLMIQGADFQQATLTASGLAGVTAPPPGPPPAAVNLTVPPPPTCPTGQSALPVYNDLGQQVGWKCEVVRSFHT
jgi:hypothetical protein